MKKFSMKKISRKKSVKFFSEMIKILIEKIEIQLQKLDDEFDMVILNDFSSLKCDISFKNLKKINRLKIINFNKNKQKKIIKLKTRIDSKKELEYLTNGGILPYVLKQICNEENSQNYDNL